MPNLINLSGQRFGRLVALHRADRPSRRVFWLCTCDCDNKTVVVVVAESLRSGRTRSCGCLRREYASRMGKANTGKIGPLNNRWRGGLGRGGTCNKCGKPTWDRSANQCRKCYHQQLRERTGAANPEWGNFTSTNPQQGRDRASRRKALGMCERCKIKPAVDRHHIDRNPLNNEPGNIQALCKSCHKIVHVRSL